MTFTEYCKANDIKLLRDDLKFIRDILQQWPPSQKMAILRRYSVVWLTAMHSEPNPILKQNSGRKAANLWLAGYNGEFMSSGV